MRKRDMELLRSIKKEEARNREKEVKVSKPSTVEDGAIHFDMWWVDACKVLKLAPYLKEILWSDFRSRGLKKEELKAKFDDAARLFGLKI